VSELDDAFTELLDFKEEATGKKEYVLLNGRKVRALVSEITIDEEFISGGTAQAGGFRCSIAVADVAEAPAKFDPIKVRGNELQILSVNEVNGVTYEITAGDPISGSR
jgi:hypothetical protein